TTVVLKNSGDATGHYSLDFMDMRMLDNGQIVPIEKGESAQYSAKPYMHVSPRSLTLKPGQIKRLQIAVRKPPMLSDGEYRTYLKIRLVNENADNHPMMAVTKKTVSISVKANLVM